MNEEEEVNMESADEHELNMSIISSTVFDLMTRSAMVEDTEVARCQGSISDDFTGDTDD